MADLRNQTETEEVSENFRYMIDDRGDAEQCWWAAVVL